MAAGTIPVASAAVLGEVVAVELSLRPELNLPGMDGSLPAVPVDGAWFTLARARSTREFQRVFLRRREEARVGGPVTKFVAYVTLAVHDDLTRARTLASRKATHALSMGQTLGVVVGDWLAANDPMRKTPGTRRVPDTTTVPTSRYVPAEVDRHVRLRTDDRCAVPFCDATMWLHRSHRVAHRDGGNREAEQLDLLCPYHHFLYESGRIRINGPADAPVVTDAHGRPSTERRPWPDRAPSQRPRQPSTTPGESPRSSVSRSAPGFVAHQRDAPASTPGDAATAGGDAASGAPPRETRTGPEPPVPSDG